MAVLENDIVKQESMMELVDMSLLSNERINQSKDTVVKAEYDGSDMLASEGEIMEIGLQFETPKERKASCESESHIASEKIETCLSLEDFPSAAICHGFTFLDSNPSEEDHLEPQIEFADTILQGVGEEHLQITDLSSCADYFSDTNFASDMPELECLLPVTDDFNISAPTCQHYSLSDGSNISEVKPWDPSYFRSLDRQETLLRTFAGDLTVNDKQWVECQTFLGVDDSSKSLNGPLLVDSRGSQVEDQVASSPSRHTELYRGAPDTETFATESPETFATESPASYDAADEQRQALVPLDLVSIKCSGLKRPNVGDEEKLPGKKKRLRRPTPRYIEESSETLSRCGNRSTGHKISENKIPGLCSLNQMRLKDCGEVAVVCRQVSFADSGVEVPVVLRVRRGRPRKNRTSLMVNDSKQMQEIAVLERELDQSGVLVHNSQFFDGAAVLESKSAGMRRKHHTSWTLQEVLQLVDCVSRHGVGRWSEIKRVEFSSSRHRTSVDLKDKWRNLLKAAQLQMKNVVDQRKKSSANVIPASILMRVRELAAMPLTERRAVLWHNGKGNYYGIREKPKSCGWSKELKSCALETQG